MVESLLNSRFVLKKKKLEYNNLLSDKLKLDTKVRQKTLTYSRTHFIHSKFSREITKLNNKKLRIVGTVSGKYSSLQLLKNWNWQFLGHIKSPYMSMYTPLTSESVRVIKLQATISRYKHLKFSRETNSFLKFSKFPKGQDRKTGILNKNLFYLKHTIDNNLRYKKQFHQLRRVNLLNSRKSFTRKFEISNTNTTTHLNELDFTNSKSFNLNTYISLPEKITSSRWNFSNKTQLKTNSSKLYSSKILKLDMYSVGLKDIFEYQVESSVNYLPNLDYLCLSSFFHKLPLDVPRLKSPSSLKSFKITRNINTTRALNLYETSSLFISPKQVIKSSLLSAISTKTNLYPTHGYIFLKTKHGLNFKFHNLSIFLTSIYQTKGFESYKIKYKWRKKIYSFIQPNEYRNSIFFRKKKSFINSIFRNRYYYNTNYSINNHISKLTYLRAQSNNLNLYNNILSSRYVNSSLGFNPFYTNEIYDYSNSSWVDYRLGISNQESRINRVRFKPGYQNLWRRVRTALKDYLGLKYIYQQQLTKYLSKFYISSTRYLWGCSEMSVSRVILYSRLLPDKSSLDLFWNKKYIFINGNLALNQNTILSPGDMIQIIISINYYIMSRWLTILTKQRHSKFKRLVYKKGLSRKYKLIKQRKQKSYYTPSWIYKNRFDFYDVKSFLEVDYFTLSAIVLYTPYLLSYHTYDNQLDLKINTFRLYNWKYIT